MSDFREEEALGKAYDSQLLRRLMTYLRPYKWSVVFAVFLTLLVGPLEVVGPYLFGYRRGQLHRPRSESHRFPGRLRCAASSLISLAFAGRVASELRGAISASPHHAERRAADALRSAQGNLRAPAAPADEFLRPQSRSGAWSRASRPTSTR